MVRFVIAGIFECVDYIHVCYVADYLAKKLPNIELEKIPKDPYDWGNWLDNINMKNKWHHTHSPLIYKELRGFGNKKHLIGGISEFWEYCFDYYGLESVLSTEDLQALQKDHLTFYGSDHLPKEVKERKLRILIYGPKTRYLWLLLGELFKIENLSTCGLEFNFFTDSPTIDFDDVLAFLQTEYGTDAAAYETLWEAAQGCDLIIITEHFSDTSKKGFKNLLFAMTNLGDLLNDEKSQLKVIFANYGHSCYPATILSSALSNANVVVVTSDKGLGPLKVLSEMLNLDARDLSGPPVWGFIGCGKIVDLRGVVKKCNVLKPFERAVKGKEDSSLAQGTVDTELRFIDYMIDDERAIWTEIRRRKSKVKERLGRSPVYAKVSAVVSLLKLWFSPDEPDEIISLGVISDGSHRIPSGIVFSQPAYLENGRWRPIPDFPVSAEIQSRIDKSVEDALKMLRV